MLDGALRAGKYADWKWAVAVTLEFCRSLTYINRQRHHMPTGFGHDRLFIRG
jgi:hypothetical protein